MKLAALAITDGLTGLKNHWAFQERLAEEAGSAGCHVTPLSLILLDMDHFKQYNNAFGHPSGDAVLRAVTASRGVSTAHPPLGDWGELLADVDAALYRNSLLHTP